MATLTNPVEEQNIVNRFADYVVSDANSSIVWGTNANPTYDDGTVVVPDDEFGGTTGGKSIGVSGANILDDPIDGNVIYNILKAETNTYTRIRNLRAVLFVDGDGGNNGSRPTAGIIYDVTNKANMSTSYLQDVGSPNNGGVGNGEVIDDADLETLFDNLRAAYRTARDNAATYQTNVCHASCHSNCHGSRGRR